METKNQTAQESAQSGEVDYTAAHEDKRDELLWRKGIRTPIVDHDLADAFETDLNAYSVSIRGSTY